MKALSAGTLFSIAQAALTSIAEERDYQERMKGFTPARDDAYTDNQLIRAACAYAVHATHEAQSGCELTHTCVMGMWPWSPATFSNCNRRRALVKAAALLVAEIERIDRANQLGKGQ